MDPIAAISGAWESVKVATNLGKAVVDLKVEGEVREKVIAMRDALLEAQQRMFEVQTSHAEMAEKLHKLENELAKHQNWEREKERYALQQFPIGTLAYGIKPEYRESEPLHCICANCYEKGAKSLLQACEDGWFKAMKCHHCGSLIRTEAIKSSVDLEDIGRSLNGPSWGL